jgi:hypothetical protein
MSKRAGMRRLRVPLVATVAVTLALVFGGTARAATIAVHTTPQLQAAVASGSSGDVILLDAGVQYAPTSALDVNRNLTIETDPAQIASGGRGATISGGVMTGASALDPSQLDILVVAAGQTLNIHNVSFTGALQPSNGDIVVMGGPPSGGSGGTLSMDHSLISSNSSNGVDVMSGGNATVTNSTITQSNGFDGILLDGNGTFNEDTIANNGGNGIDNHGGGVATIYNSILSGNTLGNCFFAITGAFGSGSNNDDSGTTCGATITTGGASSTGTGLGFIAATIANNGGPTNTYAIPAGSVAINHGTGPGAASTDQRGLVRKATPDIGAYETGAVAPVPVTLSVMKIVDNTGCSSNCAAPSDFILTVTDTTTNTVLNSSPGTSVAPGTQVTIPAGDSWTVTESGAQTVNYNPSASAGCTGSATNVGTASCTITNTFIVGSCTQPPVTTSANTCVTANVAATIIVTAPTNVSFPSLGAGETSSAVSVPVNVKSNNGTGYQLSVTRTAFTGGDIPLSIGCAAVTFPEVLDLPGGPIGPTSSVTPIPTSGPNLNIGHSGSVTNNAGDAWPFTFTLGPIPFNVPAGQHQSVVTFTAVAT